MTKEPILKVKNLRTRFETDRGSVRAVDGISFEVNHGDIVGLVGESGSGKSVTALSIMKLIGSSGIIEADQMRFMGENLLDKSESEMQDIRGGEIAMVFQDPMSSLNPVITVGEQIAEVVRHHRYTGERTGFWHEMKRKYITGTSTNSKSWRRAIELLETVGIADPEARAEQYPHQLSGGMRQRIMIAQALAGEPSLLIADEPTTALDVSIEAQVLAELEDLRDEFDISILLITHDLAIIRQMCDTITVMYAGEVMEQASSEALFENPQHPYTKGLLASIPRIDDDQEWLDAIEGSVPDPMEKPIGCPYRDRCQYAFEMCNQPLETYNIDENHISKCHLHNQEVDRDFDGFGSKITSENRPGTTRTPN
jgi:peptide/nickel transport system ATP-binding protein